MTYYNELTPVELEEDKYWLSLAMEHTADHWSDILERPVAITFATRDVTTHTGHVRQEDVYDGPDDYWVDLDLNGLHVRFNSLLDVEKYLEGVA